MDKGGLRQSTRLALAARPGDATDRYVEQMSELLGSAGDPFARDHFSPGHFTASGFVLSPSGDSILLIHHRKLGLWLQPGGHFELEDESLVDAARREIQEEVGIADCDVLEPLFDVDIHRIPAFGKEPEHAHYDLRVLFRARREEYAASNEVTAARWFLLRALVDPGPEQAQDESLRRVARHLLDARYSGSLT